MLPVLFWGLKLGVVDLFLGKGKQNKAEEHRDRDINV